MKKELVAKMKHEARESMIRKTLELIRIGYDNATDISHKLGMSDASVRLYVRVLRDSGCVQVTKRMVTHRTGQTVGQRLHYVAPYDGTPVEPETVLPFDQQLSRMMGYTDFKPEVSKVIRMLDRPVRPEPLRKINTAWMGYQSGLELA